MKLSELLLEIKVYGTGKRDVVGSYSIPGSLPEYRVSEANVKVSTAMELDYFIIIYGKLDTQIKLENFTFNYFKHIKEIFSSKEEDIKNKIKKLKDINNKYLYSENLKDKIMGTLAAAYLRTLEREERLEDILKEKESNFINEMNGKFIELKNLWKNNKIYTYKETDDELLNTLVAFSKKEINEIIKAHLSRLNQIKKQNTPIKESFKSKVKFYLSH